MNWVVAGVLQGSHLFWIVGFNLSLCRSWKEDLHLQADKMAELLLLPESARETRSLLLKLPQHQKFHKIKTTKKQGLDIYLNSIFL